MNAEFPEIPGFKIIEIIGEGAMARVYLAEQLFNNRKVRNVALKVMNRALSHDPSFRDRFFKEAEDTARFNHEGIVTIYTMAEHEERYYLALEFLESGTLKERLRARLDHIRQNEPETSTVFGDAESLNLLRQLALALSYAHEKGVVHRDIKPANILFRSNGKAVLSDFGIAKSVHDGADLTQTGHAIGTPAYMSPEQRLGADVDERSDLYSLGVVFYEVLTGKKPYDTRSGNFAQLQKQLESIPELLPELGHLQGLLNRLLARDPDDRFDTANDLIRAIDGLSPHSGGERDDATVILRPSSRAEATPPTQTWRWSRKRVLAAAGAALGIALVVVTIIWLLPEPKIEVQPVDERTAAEIEGLLGTADLFVEMDDLIDSSPSNAIDVYARVLEMQPGNPDAMAGLESAFEVVLARIEAAIDSGDHETARQQIQLCEHYFPEDKRLLRLKRKIEP